MPTYEQFLRESAVPREVIDRFLNENDATWAKFDPELGYVLSNSILPDGVDGSLTLSTVRPDGARTSAIYADQPCRINTYGDSFTQCAQVSDFETWQEYLAAHLGEPIRNYGMGGHGVYQAYRQLLHVEQSDAGADYVILYIWGDDHQRSCMRSRYPAIYPWFDDLNGLRFHANFWANIEMNLESGELVERESLIPDEGSIYNMCDPDFMWETLKDDLMVQLMVVRQTARDDDPVRIGKPDLDRLNRLSEILGLPPFLSGVAIEAGGDRSPVSGADVIAQTAQWLSDAYGFAATRRILDLTKQFLGENGKKLLVALFCPRASNELIKSGTRYDQPIVDYIDEQSLCCFDMNLVHQSDFTCFTLDIEEYWKRYSIGHYTPAGNHFFAHAIRPSIVEWLDPKPITYRDRTQRSH